MLPSSVRRVVSTAPSSPVVSSLTSSAPRAAASVFGRAYKPNGHQRRYSSSKPSSPDGGSRDFAARPTVPASGNSKTTGEKRKRKAKDAAPQLPSVPSTRHIKDEGLALSAFFALHRPISVTQLMPKTVSDDAFAQIFMQKKGHGTQRVLSTLSSAIDELEQPLSQASLEDKQEGGDKLTYKRADGTEANVYVQLDAGIDSMSGNYLPFTPPPPPQPVSDMAAEADEISAAAEEPRTRVYKTMVTIEETMDSDGQVRVVAHSPRVVEDETQPRSFLERMALRQMRWEDARQMQDGTMHAMSVKRIRKLKMKKQKYKKLRKRTRNERRKLDRL
ncbi:hypothetical protein B0T14DRAFT_560136 [Immersiella caudata]|uniref:Small ribosomal subunit protein mS38 n=1 Tax=Immersiella caudata TaxID=314043 RepID=A0AA39XEF5_9PEZI|nr:hypothetical protein B0T14DRAFT_560136 [Immersiella caudata]